MLQCTPCLSLRANAVSSRAFMDRLAMWHNGTTHAIPTVGTGFKPYGQRPKENLQ